MTEFDRQKKSNAPIMQAYHGVDVLIIDDIQNESSEAESDPQIPIQSNQPVIQVEQIKINDSIVTDTIRTEYFLKE